MLSCVRLFATPWTTPGQVTGVGSLSLPQGVLPNPGIEPRSSALQADSLPAESRGKPKNTRVGSPSLLQGSSPPRNGTEVSCIAGGFFTNRAIREANEAEVDFFFLEFSCFFYNQINFGNLIFCSSAFSKSILNIWNFSVHILLKPSLKDFEHNPTSIGSECNCLVT